MSVNSFHSSVVRMTLEVDSLSLPVSQMGPEFIILREALPERLPVEQVCLRLEVDGKVELLTLWLSDGIPSGQRKVALLSEVLAVA
jgi:hypothetical protein